MKTKKHRLDFTNLQLALYAVIIGSLTGAVIAAFRVCIQHVLNWSLLFYKTLDHNLTYLWLVIPAFLIIAIIIGLLIKGNPSIQGSGIPQVEAQLAGNIEMNWWSTLWRKFIAGVLTIGTGTFSGREGPSVQLGASVGQGVAESLKEEGSRRRVLIATGAASGLSATFSAPLAGTFFVMESIYHNFAPSIWISSLTGALCANFVSLNVFGLKPILPISYSHRFQLGNYWQLILFGIILGLLGYLYNIGLLQLPAIYAKIKILPWYLKDVIPLMLVIPIGMAYPVVIGGGSRVIMATANHNLPLKLVFIFLLLRFIFGLITDSSGIPGGIFMPILAVGSLIGAVYGGICVHFGLLAPTYVDNLMIFGMAGCFGAVSKAPFTSILLIMELVGNTKNFMPLSLVVLVAYLTTDLMGGQPIYQELAQRLSAFKVYLTNKDKTERFQLPVYPMSSVDGKRVSEVSWPNGCMLVTIRRGSLNIIPRGNTTIKPGDNLVILVHREDMGFIRNELMRLTNKRVE